MSRLYLVFPLLFACTSEGDGKGDDTDAPSDADTDTDSDTDTDTDTDTDSDADTDTDTDTVDTGPWPWDGQYVGRIHGSLQTQISQMGPISLVDCNGSLDITVDHAANDEILGTGDCSAAYDSWTVDLNGEITNDPDAEGRMQFGHQTFGFADDWVGTFTGDNLAGRASGNSGVGKFPYVEWDVDFSVDR